MENIKTAGKLLLLSVVFLQVYLYTMFPAYKNNDSPETAAYACTLGIAHPPSYPLFNLAARIFSMVPVGNPAFRISLFSSFLAVIALIFTFYLIEKCNSLVFKREYRAISYISLVILAFSSVFWSQAIEAKGGIYMLNLVFFIALLYMAVSLIEKFDLRRLYIMSYLIGLSLSNHWPSVVILAPIFAYFYIRHRKQITIRGFAVNVLLLLIGLSAYLYLPIRGGADGVFAFMAKPNTWENFWWTVLRSAYLETTEAAAGVLKNQMAEAGLIILKNHGFLGLFAIPGIYAVYKYKRNAGYLYTLIFAVVVFFVIAFNRGSKDALWFIDVFMLPALYIMFIFITAGLVQTLDLVKPKALKKYAPALFGAAAFFAACAGFNANNNNRNFLFYDFSNNILKTLTKGCFYLAEGDFFNLTMPYAGAVEKKLDNINYVALYSLMYKWGIDAFAGKYGDMGMQPGHGGDNAVRLINNFSDKTDVYTSIYVKPIENEIGLREQKAKGILYKISRKNEKIQDSIFRLYSYRGIYDAKTLYDRELAAVYGAGMDFMALARYNENDFQGAVNLGEKVLRMPGTSDDAYAHYNLALSYLSLGDNKNALRCLINAMKYQPVTCSAYEIAGRIYYGASDMPNAKNMFEKAVNCGIADPAEIRKYLARIEKIRALTTQ